jgi:hypothetical protein
MHINKGVGHGTLVSRSCRIGRVILGSLPERFEHLSG